MVALVYGPAMPALYQLAAINLIISYVLDRILLLRGSHRPPFHDDALARDCLWFLCIGAMIHCISAAVVFQDQDLFPTDADNCGGDTQELRAQPMDTDIC